MNYIENTYICLAAPVLLSIICLRKDARRLLGYDPEWSFDRGIQAAIDWYRENL